MKNKFLGILVLLVVFGCLKPDTTSPEFKVASLLDGSDNIALDSVFTFTFSEELKDSFIYGENVKLLEKNTGNVIACTIYLDGLAIVLKPVSFLSSDTDYKIIISGVTDKAGNKLADDIVFFFKTVKKVEEVTGSNPSNPSIPNVSQDKIAYVAVSGDDVEGDGSQAKPFGSIKAAVESLSKMHSTTEGCQILVGVGTYKHKESLMLYDSISIYGGFNPETWERLPIYNEELRAKNQTLITYADDAEFYYSHIGIISDSRSELYGKGEGKTKSFVIDGFSFGEGELYHSVNLGFSDASYVHDVLFSNNTFYQYVGNVIIVDGGVMGNFSFQDNYIVGTTPDSAIEEPCAWVPISIGCDSAKDINISGNKIVVDNNSSLKLRGFSVTQIFSQGGTLSFYNNLVYLNNVDEGCLFSFCGNLDEIFIYNNTMVFSNNSKCRFTENDKKPESLVSICNNIVSMGSTDSDNSFFPSDDAIWAISENFNFSNNAISGGTLKESDFFLANGNQCVEVLYSNEASHDFSLTSGNSSFVLSGGLDLSQIFANDIAKKNRSSWSLGAYEY